MKSILFQFLAILASLISCNVQSVTEKITAKGNTVDELGNNIMLVYQDKKNNYWFGSQDDGLYHYDGEKILHFTTKDGLPDNGIIEIKEDKLGNVYFNTNKGISKFDSQDFFTLHELDSSDWKLNHSDMWFKSSGHLGYVYRYDGKILYKLQLPKTKLGDDYFAKHPTSPNPYSIYTVYKDNKGNIWFGTGTLGACRYNGKSFDWISEEDVTEMHEGPANGVRSIIEDKDGYFWFNTMYRYNVYNQEKAFYKREKGIGILDGNKDGILNEYLSITKDNNNNLWMVTYNAGVWRYDGKKITHYPVQDQGKNITLFSIYKDSYGNLWLGTHANGTFKFDGKKFEKVKL